MTLLQAVDSGMLWVLGTFGSNGSISIQYKMNWKSFTTVSSAPRRMWYAIVLRANFGIYFFKNLFGSVVTWRDMAGHYGRASHKRVSKTSSQPKN
eukprot:1394150-Amorphochlora_amoeboformis.AAC.2